MPIAFAYCLLRCLYIALVALEAPLSGEELAEDEAAAASMVAKAVLMQPVLSSRPHTRGVYSPFAFVYCLFAQCLLPFVHCPFAYCIFHGS